MMKIFIIIEHFENLKKFIFIISNAGFDNHKKMNGNHSIIKKNKNSTIYIIDKAN